MSSPTPGRNAPPSVDRSVVWRCSSAVFGELRKVVTPTRRELINYTLVVLVFVVIMMGIVYGLDTVFSLLVNFLFGDPAVVTG